jgi:3-dehydroquinate synthase
MKVLEIRGQTGTSRVFIGERIANLPSHLPGGRPIFITDTNVRRLYPAVFSGLPTIELPAGEEAKSLETVAFIYGKLLELGADRSTFVVGVGGGVVCDLAGFAASTFLRGLGFGYAATTLLAQVDASVGGKTGVNFGGYKNMVGVFEQPRFVLCDPAVLSTLPRREVLSGMAEVVKHAAIGSRQLFETLETRSRDALELRPDLLEDIIGRSVAVKAAVVGRDEKEADERRVLNFGHTLGHAFEARLGLSHGEAVSLGMAAAADLSVRKGLLAAGDAGRFRGLLTALGLPTSVPFDRDAIIDAVRKDKKRDGAGLKFVFLKGLGEPVISDVPLGELEGYIHDLR